MSERNSETDRLGEALRAAATDARPREDCPEAERIWAAVHQELPLSEREAIIDHTVECGTCAEAWRLAMEIRRTDELEAEAASHERSMLRQPAVWALAAAATLVLAVVVMRPWAPPPAPGLRDPGSAVLQSLVVGDALPRTNFLLRWSGGSPDARYELTATTSDLEVLALVRGLDRPEYLIPSDRLAQLPSGALVLWRVVARASDGSTLASQTFETPVQ